MADDSASCGPPPSPILLAGRFLLPCRPDIAAEAPTWRLAGIWFVPWGIVIGISYAVVLTVAWRWFGQYESIRWVPMAVLLAVDLGFGGHRLLGGITSLGPPVGAEPHMAEGHRFNTLPLNLVTAVVLVAIVKYALLVSIPVGHWESVAPGADQTSGWTGRWAILFPTAIYRPVILMPICGRWAMMLACVLGRAAPDASPRLVQLTSGLRLWIVLLTGALVLPVLIIYSSGAVNHLHRGLLIAFVTAFVSYCTAFTLARRWRGQTEASVCATGLAAEVAFLASYSAVINPIYWY